MVGVIEDKQDKQEGDNTQIEGQKLTSSKGMNQNNTDVIDTSQAAAIVASNGIMVSGIAKENDHKAGGA